MRALLLDLRESLPASRRVGIDRHLALLDASVERAFSTDEERSLAMVADAEGLGSAGRSAEGS